MPDFTVTIEIHESAYRVFWSWDGLKTKAYMIDAGDVNTIATAIRACLNELVTNALERAKALKHGDDTKIAEIDAGQSSVLCDLAREGRRLHGALFTRFYGSQVNQIYINRIREKISSQTSKRSICFLVKPRVYIPWGLIYEGAQPSPGPGVNKPTNFGDFWCLKHQIATIYDELASPLDFDVSYEADSFHVLSAADLTEFQKSQAALEDPGEQRVLEALMSRFGQPAKSSESLVSAWQQVAPRLGLLYLYCHANERNLGFSVEDTMDVIDFKNQLTKNAESPLCLVFLNGCHTAAHHESGTFLEATGRDGFCGYVGTETVVPCMFAFRFGLAFQSLLFGGSTVAGIMDQLRRQHWPLSLIYGLYAYPHLKVKPNPDFAIPAMPDANYSDGTLGERTL